MNTDSAAETIANVRQDLERNAPYVAGVARGFAEEFRLQIRLLTIRAERLRACSGAATCRRGLFLAIFWIRIGHVTKDGSGRAMGIAAVVRMGESNASIMRI